MARGAPGSPRSKALRAIIERSLVHVGFVDVCAFELALACRSEQQNRRGHSVSITLSFQARCATRSSLDRFTRELSNTSRSGLDSACFVPCNITHQPPAMLTHCTSIVARSTATP